MKKRKNPTYLKRTGLLLALSVIGVCESGAQPEFKLPETREVIIIQGDSTVKAHVMYNSEKRIRTKDGMKYHWYAANSIRQNIGDYDGKLLSGPFKIFDGKNNLVLKGEYQYGLKHGKWTAWYPDGKVKSIENWKKGNLHGAHTIYSAEGKLVEQSEYRKGEKMKKAKEFDGKSDYNKVKYVELKEVPKESDQETKKKQKFWPVFKKKEKEEDPERGAIESKEKKEKKDKKKGQKRPKK